MMAGMLTGQLAANREQLELLGRARREPWLLDDATVDRVKKVFGVQRDDMWLPLLLFTMGLRVRLGDLQPLRHAK